MKSNATSSKGRIVARGFVVGLALGVISRLWMRWISTDPEFSWSGTIFIVGAFTVLFTAQSIVSIFRRGGSSRRRRRVVRAGGIVFTLPIFMAAGGIMFPTVALASFALWTGVMKKRGQIILLILSSIIPIRVSMDIVGDFGWSISTIGRILLFVGIYVVVIIAIRPTLSPHEGEDEVRISSISRKKKAIIFLGLLVIVALFLLFTVGVPGS